MTHPITVPPELVEQWYDAIDNQSTSWKQQLATRAAQWGADQELEACCEYVYERLKVTTIAHIAQDLRTARRFEPKPPSLKQQALKELAWVGEHLDMPLHNYCNAIHTIQRALEQLDD